MKVENDFNVVTNKGILIKIYLTHVLN